MARKVREDAAVVRDRVERAAMRLFALHGSAAVSVQAIADAVGMSKQAVLYHYGNKGAIRAAVLDRVSERVRTWVESFTTTAGAWTVDGLADRVYEVWQQDPYVPGVILREVVEDPDRAGSAIQTGTLANREQVAQLLGAAQAGGLVRADVDTARYFDRVSLMLIATLALPPLGGPDADEAEAKAMLRETLRIALVAVLAEPAAYL